MKKRGDNILLQPITWKILVMMDKSSLPFGEKKDRIHYFSTIQKEITTVDILDGKRVIVFSVPGAFTPNCSKQLPDYEYFYDIFCKEYAIDEVYCLAVNDAYVMNAWKKELDIQKIQMIPDGSGLFTRMMGMGIIQDEKGFGYRSWRYSMIVDNGTIEKMFVEEGMQNNDTEDPYKKTDARTILRYFEKTSATKKE